jgi:hypothetical protein
MQVRRKASVMHASHCILTSAAAAASIPSIRLFGGIVALLIVRPRSNADGRLVLGFL